jgi:polyhydroxybutyrate depolymerase
MSIFSIGLVVAIALLMFGCSSDEPAEQSGQSQARSASGVQQQSTAEETKEQEAQPGQPESDQAAEEQQQSDQAAAARVEQEQSAQQDVQAAQAEQQQQQPEQQQQEAAPANEFKLAVGGDRPATLLLPKGLDRSQPRPLIVLLHGYGSYALQVDQYFRFSGSVDSGGFGLLIPDGTPDRNGAQFWNGTDECCDLFGAGIDDVSYLKSLISEAGEYAEFDQVFAVGHSNGGFMAYRLACEQVPGLSGIVSLAGGAHADGDDCRVPEPLSVLQIHGTEDELVLYETGRLPIHPDEDRKPVPGAWASVTRWAERANCDLNAMEELPAIDADIAVEGVETTIKRYSKGCAAGAVMELWTIEGGGHVPIVWDTDFTPGILKWIADVYNETLSASELSSSQPVAHTIGGDRPAQLLLPDSREGESLPLILSLHGYEGNAEAHDWYFGLSDRILGYNFALITPQGSSDQADNPFWNATDGCCNFYDSQIDDYGWLTSLVDDAREIVDVAGVYVVGYSNGGFMAYRLACDGLDGLVAIASLAGSSFGDPERCTDAAPVSVLQIHGSDDASIPYGGTLEYDNGYPGAVELATRWANLAGCNIDASADLPNIDLEKAVDGAETSVRRIRDGCDTGITIELWTISGTDHLPFFHDDWPDRLLNWLLNESRANQG